MVFLRSRKTCPFDAVATNMAGRNTDIKLARFNRKQVLKANDWMDEAMPF